MTRDDFIEKYRHELAGMILDGATGQRSGSDLGMFCRAICKKVDVQLAKMFDALAPKAEPAKGPATPSPNGTARVPGKV